MGRSRDIFQINVYRLVVVVGPLAVVACAEIALRDAETRLEGKLHPHEIEFEVTASGSPVDPRVADAVNAAIEQTIVERGRTPSDRMETLAYAVARGRLGGRMAS